MVKPSAAATSQRLIAIIQNGSHPLKRAEMANMGLLTSSGFFCSSVKSLLRRFEKEISGESQENHSVVYHRSGNCRTTGVIAQQSATEAPAGFTTPTIGQTLDASGQVTGTPGVQSISNGIAEPPGDSFALTKPNSSGGTIRALDWARSLTLRLARIAIRMA